MSEDEENTVRRKSQKNKSAKIYPPSHERKIAPTQWIVEHHTGEMSAHRTEEEAKGFATQEGSKMLLDSREEARSKREGK